jgi:hypothetical protein
MMDRFNFMMVLLSIIVGLGITEILVNIARQIKMRKSSKASWIHSGIVAMLFLGFLQIWWESWGLRELDQWAFPHLLLLLVTPVGLFIISHLVYPDTLDGVDMETYYFDNTRLLWLAAALMIPTGMIFNAIAFGGSVFIMGNLTTFLMVGLFVLLAFCQYRPLHMAAVPTLMVLLILDVMIFQPYL